VVHWRQQLKAEEIAGAAGRGALVVAGGGRVAVSNRRHQRQRPAARASTTTSRFGALGSAGKGR
jgi:hypothetical protein